MSECLSFQYLKYISLGMQQTWVGIIPLTHFLFCLLTAVVQLKIKLTY